jgi:hypothetical protein
VPTPTPSDDPGHLPSRRLVLGLFAAGGLAVAGCSPLKVQQPASGRPTLRRAPQLDPDVQLAAITLDKEQRVVDLVVATERRHPGLRPVLADARNAHEEHVKILTKAVPESARPSATASATAAASGSASPSPSPSPNPSPGAPSTAATPSPETVTVPSDPGKALAKVTQHEDQLAVNNKQTAFAAQSGEFARLLASMAGSAAQQAAMIRMRRPGVAG